MVVHEIKSIVVENCTTYVVRVFLFGNNVERYSMNPHGLFGPISTLRRVSRKGALSSRSRMQIVSCLLLYLMLLLCHSIPALLVGIVVLVRIAVQTRKAGFVFERIVIVGVRCLSERIVVVVVVTVFAAQCAAGGHRVSVVAVSQERISKCRGQIRIERRRPNLGSNSPQGVIRDIRAARMQGTAGHGSTAAHHAGGIAGRKGIAVAAHKTVVADTSGTADSAKFIVVGVGTAVVGVGIQSHGGFCGCSAVAAALLSQQFPGRYLGRGGACGRRGGRTHGRCCRCCCSNISVGCILLLCESKKQTSIGRYNCIQINGVRV